MSVVRRCPVCNSIMFYSYGGMRCDDCGYEEVSCVKVIVNGKRK
jgi:DNA-directed RNA polymerase subunit M/transcription elongation factor TFIIS